MSKFSVAAFTFASFRFAVRAGSGRQPLVVPVRGTHAAAAPAAPGLCWGPRRFWGRGRGQGHLLESKHKSFTISPNVTRCHGFVPGLEFMSNVKHTEIQTEGTRCAEGSHRRFVAVCLLVLRRCFPQNWLHLFGDLCFPGEPPARAEFTLP